LDVMGVFILFSGTMLVTFTCNSTRSRIGFCQKQRKTLEKYEELAEKHPI